MNFSTNQVKQMFVLTSGSTVTPKVITTPDGNVKKAVVFDIDGDRTDIIPINKVLYTNLVEASDTSEQLFRKAITIALDSNVNSGNPVGGQDYIIDLTFRGHIGEEVAYHKFAEAHAVTGMTAAVLLQKLALSFLKNSTVEPSPLYELYATDGTLLNESNIASKVTETGFVVVEAAPYWRLGSFPETLMNIAISTRPIIVNSDEVDTWLASYAFAPDTTESYVDAIPNTHKVADLEYFCKGERGVSAFLSAPYDAQIPVNLKVNANDKDGYDILTIHYAFVGANASNQKSEKDLIVVAPTGGSALATMQAALVGLTPEGIQASQAETLEDHSETLEDHESRIEALEA